MSNEELLYQATGRRDLDVIYEIDDYIGIVGFDGSIAIELRGSPTSGEIVWLGFRKMREERLTDILDELLEVVAALEPYPRHTVSESDFSVELWNEDGVAFRAFGGQIKGEYLHDEERPGKGIIQWFKFINDKHRCSELGSALAEMVRNIEL